MTRARATSLVLVNWKGVFYERYQLNRHVTALEGDNGAGKTTVMIGAYVVLLPDMTRLRFTNLGETGATGGDKGIWGRLGEQGRPSYAVLDFDLGGREQVLAGVHLERKGEPTVEPTPFIVTGLPQGQVMQDLFLLTHGEDEHVPELPELKESVARLGGHLKVFDSARDYFAALFEHGITPMKMGTDAERNKLNEMLRTSMTGGMSRGLVSELRSFLLKEDGGLAGTLRTMRANLDACRRTRTEVREAQRLEREIGSIYEAGEAMFGAAIAATRERSVELAKKVDEAAVKRAACEVAMAAAEAAVQRVSEELLEAGEGKKIAEQALEAAQLRVEKVSLAVDWQEKLHRRETVLESARNAHEQAVDARSKAEESHSTAVLELEQADEAREAAARGVGDLEAGLSELHRRADAHRRVVAQLDTARTKLGSPQLQASDVVNEAGSAATELERVDQSRRELSRRVDDAIEHRQQHEAAMDALTTILQEQVEPASAASAAVRAGTVVRDWRSLASQRGQLRTELAIAMAEASKQSLALKRAEALNLEFEPGQGRDAVARAFEQMDDDILRHREAELLARSQAKDAGRALQESLSNTQRLSSLQAVYRRLLGLAGQLSVAVENPVTHRASLEQARAELSQRAENHRREEAAERKRREELFRQARAMRTSGGQFPDELLRLRDHLAADLLAGHFDEVTVDEAAEVEAQLGPLVHGLVVEDLEGAAGRIQGRSDELPTVWLISADAALSLDPDETLGSGNERDVVVKEGDSVRVTRVPARPTLGRLAREQRAEELEAMAADLDPRIEELGAAKREAQDLLALADELLEGLGVWLAGDPTPKLDAAREAATLADARKEQQLGVAELAGSRVKELEPIRTRLGELLPDAALLDPPDYGLRAQALGEKLALADGAAVELSRVGNAPTRLEEHQLALRVAPMMDSELVAAQAEVKALEDRRGELADALEALRYVATNRNALAWTDAAEQLRSSQELAPALRAQLEQAIAVKKAAQEAERSARGLRDEAVEAWNTADVALKSATTHRDEASQELLATGVAEPTEALLREAKTAASQSRTELGVLDHRVGELQRSLGMKESERSVAEEARNQAVQSDEDERMRAKPAFDAWERLERQATQAGVLDEALTERFRVIFGGSGSLNIWPRAREEKRVLLERMSTAQGGHELLEMVENWLEKSDQTTAEGYLQAWLLVRDWLRRRLPAQIAEVDEPLVALARLREHLSGLGDRLDRQESDLRGASEDIARGIDVQVRRAQGQVRRLNKHLEGVCFGSIAKIRVKLQRVERMEQVLRALREGAGQALLFQASMPVEEALEEIFKRFGGGRSGGAKLLDYREYLHLQVQVTRIGGVDWEDANPTRLSTGEAIGVGAALMMVVLTEWERDANMLRGRRALGSMRFLFLDEANRLDNANLGTLFELCRNLDLQLLVAAPSVERGAGCTVYRLVRTRSIDGREHVLVSGRRVVGEA